MTDIDNTTGTGTTEVHLAEMPMGELVASIASAAPTPGGGAVAALAAALAASLAAMTARYSTASGLPDAEGLAERADALRDRALGLADDDARVYRGYVAASRIPREPGPERRRAAVREALDAAADVPLDLAGLAREIAEAGETLVRSGNPRLHSDALTTSCLAAAAAAGAAALVTDNLAARPADPRARLARRHGRAAAAAARRATDDHLSEDVEEEALHRDR
jgi:formiminotetrahydrofolate cyclodeaminase